MAAPVGIKIKCFRKVVGIGNDSGVKRFYNKARSRGRAIPGMTDFYSQPDNEGIIMRKEDFYI